MPDHSSDRRDRRRGETSYLSGSEERRPSYQERHNGGYDKGRERRRSRDGRIATEGSRSKPKEDDRSRSPYTKRQNRRRTYSPDSQSPKRQRNDSRENNKPSKHGRSRSLSRSPKRRRRDSPDSSRPKTHHRRKPSTSPRAPSPTLSIAPIRSKAPLPSQQAAFTNNPSSTTHPKAALAPETEKQKPNYAPTGKLAAETNTVAGTTIVLKYNEPPEARLPPSSTRWRLYVFKGPALLEKLELATRSCWLFGRERAVVDFPTEHPSCSKQHAVLQFRFVERKNEFGDKEGGVRPYVIDLDSANGTSVNGDKVEGRRYVEIRSGDVVTFGDSTREYVLMLPPAG